MPIPKYVSKAKRQAILSGRIYPAVKPDLDNLAKQLKDAMTRMAFRHDERQVAQLECAKIYGEETCWRVTVVPLEYMVETCLREPVMTEQFEKTARELQL